MKKHLPFRIRLLFSFLAIPALFLLLPLLYCQNKLEERFLEATKATALSRMRLVSGLLLRDPSVKDYSSLHQWCGRMGESFGMRISYLNQEGEVVADSQLPYDKLDSLQDFSKQPEVARAFREGIGMDVHFNRSFQEDAAYAARAVDPPSLPPGVLRIALPPPPFRKDFEEMAEFLWAVVFLAFPTSAGLAVFMARRLGHPIQQIVGVAEAVSHGDYKQRVYFYPNQEFYPLAEALNRMAENIEGQIQAVTDRKRRFEAILNGMREGVMFLDARGKIRAVNRSLTAILPNPPASIGRRPMEVLLNSDLQSACDEVLAGRAHHHLEIRLPNDRFYEINLVRIDDLRGGAGAVVVFHDISELKRLENVRRDFVANVSHELRTPLTSIKGYAETLLGDESMDVADARFFLDTILRNADNMTNMVDDLLELAKLEGKSSEKSFGPVDVTEAFAIAWEICAPIALGRQVHLENRLPESGIMVYGNMEQLVEVFRNLFENAIRYSPTGETITVFSRGDHGNVTLGVQDRGPGISKSHHRRIFERFYRVDKHRANDTGGTGLGLAICRHIVRNHGGRIWVESRPGEGAVFYFTLKGLLREEGLSRETGSDA